MEAGSRVVSAHPDQVTLLIAYQWEYDGAKVSASLPDEDVELLDAYARDQGLP
ncbi:hypothetical protein [Aciditerrimonas ferrireducens]|uniref:hypothetical protein n=1 Tax=Aciditerrimonas ferrireducens TaxID=667306 RepID=UPI002005BCF9|nr:hypothetical protein [Aciditerrimonas ferrireducens]MCK4177540.1 hypothetical protein [Aciditerrimonas ferrireducens]